MTSTKTFSLEQCQLHRTEDTCWLIINGKVYDVTEFLDEHPGGYDIIVSAAGRDSTEDFEEIGHSNAAKEMLDKYLIGEFEGGAAAVPDSLNRVPLHRTNKPSAAAAAIKALLPLLAILAAVVYALYVNKQL